MMISETGQVLSVEDDWVWVKTLRQSTCGACHARVGCGQNLLSRMVAAPADIKARLQPLIGLEDLQPGDEVDIAIEEGAVVAASLLAYGIPLLMLVSMVAVGDWFAASNLLITVLGTMGLAAGVVASRIILLSRYTPAFFEPVVLRRISQRV